jgi:hypothetical protein
MWSLERKDKRFSKRKKRGEMFTVDRVLEPSSVVMVVALIVTARKMQSQRRQTVSPTTYVPGRPPAG